MTRQLDLTVQGVVGTNPVLSRVGDNARPYCRFRVAVTPTYRTERGWNNAETIWFTAKAWGQLAANLSHSLHRGTQFCSRDVLPGVLGEQRQEARDQRHHASGRWARPDQRRVPLRARESRGVGAFRVLGCRNR